MEKKKNSLKHVIFSTVFLLSFFPAIAFATHLPGIPNGWSEGFVYVNGIRIHYYHAVPAPGKPVIVAIHGVMDTGLAWASVVGKLQNDYDIYMPDTRGHGLSDPFNGSEDSNTLVKDVVAFVHAMHFKKPILMGHSMGAATVMRVGAEYPDIARAIIMVDPFLRPIDTTRQDSGGHGVPSRAPQRYESTPGHLSVSMFGTPEELVAQNNYSFDDLMAKAHRENPRWSMMDCRYWALAIKRYHGPYTRAAWQAMSGTMGTGNSLAKITVPALVLKRDEPADVRKTERKVASVMQKGKLVFIDNSAHNIERDQPARMTEVIKEFLSTLKMP